MSTTEVPSETRGSAKSHSQSASGIAVAVLLAIVPTLLFVARLTILSGGSSANFLFVLDYGTPAQMALGAARDMFPAAFLLLGYMFDPFPERLAETLRSGRFVPPTWRDVVANVAFLVGLNLTSLRVLLPFIGLVIAQGVLKGISVRVDWVRAITMPLGLYANVLMNPVLYLMLILGSMQMTYGSSAERFTLRDGSVHIAQVLGTSGDDIAVLEGRPLHAGFIAQDEVTGRVPCSWMRGPDVWDQSMATWLFSPRLAVPESCTRLKSKSQLG